VKVATRQAGQKAWSVADAVLAREGRFAPALLRTNAARTTTDCTARRKNLAKNAESSGKKYSHFLVPTGLISD
jgi:hypothetical protein